MTLLANAPVAMMITWMVILIGSLLFGLAPGRTRTIQPLGPQRKRLALGVVLIGLCTAGLPMVILDPPLLNKSQWTPLNIALKVYQRELPVSRGSLDNSVIEMVFIYLLMLLALVALSILGLPKLLKGISGFGFVLRTLVKFWHHSFLNTFGWQYFGSGYLRPGLPGGFCRGSCRRCWPSVLQRIWIADASSVYVNGPTVRYCVSLLKFFDLGF
jgi:hypothetical protein